MGFIVKTKALPEEPPLSLKTPHNHQAHTPVPLCLTEEVSSTRLPQGRHIVYLDSCSHRTAHPSSSALNLNNRWIGRALALRFVKSPLRHLPFIDRGPVATSRHSPRSAECWSLYSLSSFCSLRSATVGNLAITMVT